MKGEDKDKAEPKDKPKTEIELGNVTIHDTIVPLSNKHMYILSVCLILAFTFFL